MLTALQIMFGLRFSKIYLLLFPLALYVCLMYRLLDNTCYNNLNDNFDKYPSSDALLSGKSRKIMQFRLLNNSNRLRTLTQQYEILEKQRKDLLQKIKSAISADEVIGQLYSNELDTSGTKSDFINFQGYYNPNEVNIIMKPRYMFNCTNIHQIKLLRKVGHGVSKQAFQGNYNGLPVAVKMVTRHQIEVKNCIEKLRDSKDLTDQSRSQCFVFSTMKLMKEILLLEQLDHPGFTRLLGYCVRSEESDTSDLSERGIVSIFELGQRFVLNNLQILPWQQRLKYAIDLSDFLVYLEYSPLGSLRVRDFKESHFLMVNGSIKMIDLDDVDNLEPSCTTYVNSETPSPSDGGLEGDPACGFGLRCQRGLCIGFNAKQNMKYMTKLFFKRLLFPTTFPESIASSIGHINIQLDNVEISCQDLHQKLSILYNEGLNYGSLNL